MLMHRLGDDRGCGEHGQPRRRDLGCVVLLLAVIAVAAFAYIVISLLVYGMCPVHTTYVWPWGHCNPGLPVSPVWTGVLIGPPSTPRFTSAQGWLTTGTPGTAARPFAATAGRGCGSASAAARSSGCPCRDRAASASVTGCRSCPGANVNKITTGTPRSCPAGGFPVCARRLCAGKGRPLGVRWLPLA